MSATEVAVSTIDELALDIAELRTRVQLTEDTLAIYDLKARYGELVDQRYWRGNVVDNERLGVVSHEIAKLFTSDATWDGGPTLGRAGVWPVGHSVSLQDKRRRVVLDVWVRRRRVRPHGGVSVAPSKHEPHHRFLLLVRGRLGPYPRLTGLPSGDHSTEGAHEIDHSICRSGSIRRVRFCLDERGPT
jgi:hypothetical protein